MLSQVGKDSGFWIAILVFIMLIIILIVSAAYYVGIIGGIAGGSLSIYNYGLSFKKNVVDENFSLAK